MPKLEPKTLQKELEQGWIWPVYWIYGTERMKIRELVARIKKATLTSDATLGPSLSEESFDATDPGIDASVVLDAALSPALGGGVRLIVVREAHSLKDAETLVPLLGDRVKVGPHATQGPLTSVCVLLSKDLDGRKKFSKTLVEHAAVIACDEVPEAEREAWVQYLAKRRGMTLEASVSSVLSQLDPWSLDAIDQELEKFSVGGSADVILGVEGSPDSNDFLDAFFSRDSKRALRCVQSFSDKPEEALPLLGLLAWNVRHLALVVATKEQGHGSGALKLSPYIAEKLRAWSRHWKLGEILAVQARVAELDFAIKQTPQLPLGAWSVLVESI
jgi:DNA polymerase-3 subunit delta